VEGDYSQTFPFPHLMDWPQILPSLGFVGEGVGRIRGIKIMTFIFRLLTTSRKGSSILLNQIWIADFTFWLQREGLEKIRMSCLFFAGRDIFSFEGLGMRST
jgi:hypothetical protein